MAFCFVEFIKISKWYPVIRSEHSRFAKSKGLRLFNWESVFFWLKVINSIEHSDGIGSLDSVTDSVLHDITITIRSEQNTKCVRVRARGRQRDRETKKAKEQLCIWMRHQYNDRDDESWDWNLIHYSLLNLVLNMKLFAFHFRLGWCLSVCVCIYHCWSFCGTSLFSLLFSFLHLLLCSFERRFFFRSRLITNSIIWAQVVIIQIKSSAYFMLFLFILQSLFIVILKFHSFSVQCNAILPKNVTK